MPSERLIQSSQLHLDLQTCQTDEERMDLIYQRLAKEELEESAFNQSLLSVD